MLQLIWIIFSIAIYLSFIFLCFKAIGLLKREMGLGAAIVFSIGILATCNNSRNSDSNSQLKQAARFMAEKDPLLELQPFKRIVIHKNLMFNIGLSYNYAVNRKTNEVQPLNAVSNIEGIAGTLKWIPSYVTLQTDTTGTALEYEVWGAIEWRLFNAAIITENKQFNGTISIDLPREASVKK